MNRMSFDRIVAMKYKIYFKTQGIIFFGRHPQFNANKY